MVMDFSESTFVINYDARISLKEAMFRGTCACATG